MGPHQHVQIAVGQILEQLASFGSRSGTGEQLDGDMQLRQPLAKVAVVLLRQHLGGGHQSPLPSCADRAEQGSDRHHRFSGTHIALHQPRHRFGALQIRLDFSEHPLLSRGEGKGQEGEKLRHQTRGG